MKILTTALPGTDEWKKAHKGKMGGTDIAAICSARMAGVKAFKTSRQVWAELTEKAVDQPTITNDEEEDDELPAIKVEDYLRWGTKSEPLHRELLELDAKQRIGESPGLVEDAEFSWIAGTPDGIIEAPTLAEGFGVAEYKAPMPWTRKDWLRGAPLGYRIQHALYMRVCGAQWGIVSALMPPEVKWQRLQRTKEFEDLIMECVIDFREKYILKDIMPPISDVDKDAAVLKLVYPHEDTSKILDWTGDAQALDLVYRMQEQSTVKGAAEKAYKRAKLELADKLGAAAFAIVAPGIVVKCVTEGKEGIVTYPSHPSRKLRIVGKVG